jgi:DNA helicase-2/ATP-dependent DNA helicase PcrA
MATGTSEELEEERRLLYVAMTRAKEHLHLLVPQRFYVSQQSAAATATCTPGARASSPRR